MKNYNYRNDTEIENYADKPVEISKRGIVSNCYLVNVRKAADINSDVIAKLGKRCDVIVTGDPINGFYPVKYGEQTGFIKSEYLEVT